jgi:hypothetical protein
MGWGVYAGDAWQRLRPPLGRLGLSVRGGPRAVRLDLTGINVESPGNDLDGG